MDVLTAKFLIIFAFTYVQLVHCLKSMSVISRFPEQKIFYSRLVSYSHEKPLAEYFLIQITERFLLTKF